MKKLLAFLTLSLCFGTACASNLCQRKDKWMSSHCAGGDVSYTGDPTCEAASERCTPGQLEQLRGYVQCLEAQNVCSLDTMAACQQQFPGGVNLSCGG